MQKKKIKINYIKLTTFILYNIFNVMLFYILYKNNVNFTTFLILYYSTKINMILLNNEK